MLAGSAADVQGIDEISRKWLRSREDVQAYFDMLGGAVSDTRTVVSDIHETVWGDTAIATMWAEQDYKMEGSPTHISVPMTMALRNEGGWKPALISAVPLPAE